MSLLIFLTGIVFIFLYVLPGTHSWGKEGHYITCKIAEVSDSHIPAAMGVLIFIYQGISRTIAMHFVGAIV